MVAHKIETVVPADGILRLADLPFDAGVQIEVIVLVREKPQGVAVPTFPLRGTPGEMHDPFEPAVNPDDWDALR